MKYEIREPLISGEARYAEVTLFDDEIATAAFAYSAEIKRKFDKDGLDGIPEEEFKLSNPNNYEIDEQGRKIRKLIAKNLTCITLRQVLHDYHRDTKKDINRLLVESSRVDQIGGFVDSRMEYGNKALLLAGDIRDAAEKGMFQSSGSLIELPETVFAGLQAELQAFLDK